MNQETPQVPAPEVNTEVKTPEVKPPSRSLAELRQLASKRAKVAVEIEGAPFEFEVRRPSPAEVQAVDELVLAIFPPIVKRTTKEGKEEELPDMTDEGYRKRKIRAEQERRSLLLYWCVTEINAEKPGLKKIEDIHAFVSGKAGVSEGVAPDAVLDMLFLATQRDDILFPSLVNFT